MSQLDALTIANVKKGSLNTYAHCCCTIFFFAWVMLVIRSEKIYYLDLKNEYRVLKRQVNHPDSRTVLFTNVVRDTGNLRGVYQVFGDMYGVQIHFATDVRFLAKILRQRTSLVDKIDTILTGLAPEHFEGLGSTSEKSTANTEMPTTGAILPSVSLKSKMEAVKHYAAKIKSMKVDENQKLHRDRCLGSHITKGSDRKLVEREAPRLLSSVFVQFDSVVDAEVACRSRFHNDLTRFVPQCMDASPKDICWENLGHGWWQSQMRKTLSQAIILGMIIFWSVPVAIATALTNIENIVPDSWWSQNIPPLIRNASSGLLPSLVLSMLMSLPPKIIARLARFAGVLTLGQLEGYIQNYYFCFRVVQVFLVAALGSTATAVLAQIYSDPGNATTVLAKKLPGASNFYLSYFVVQGFTEAALVVLNLGGLLSRCLLSGIFDDTPRKKARRRKECFQISSGTVLAACSSLLVIALCYAPTAPLVLCFATIAFTMFYLSYRHNLFFVANLAADTSGRIYHRALEHTMVGIYIGELYLIGLFTVASLDGRRLSGQLVLSSVLLAGTFVFQNSSAHSLQRWHDSAPWSGPDNYCEKVGIEDTRFPMSLHFKMCAVFLDDVKAICEVLAVSENMVRSGQREGYEFLSPVVVEREADILLTRGVDSFAQAMLGTELHGTFPARVRGSCESRGFL